MEKKNYKIDGVPLKDLRILITGGAGVIGSEMVLVLSRLGLDKEQISVLDNLSSSKLETIEEFEKRKLISFIKGDIRDINTLKKAVKDVDVVIHLASNADVRYDERNGTDLELSVSTTGTYNVLEAMRVCDVNRLLFSSSSSVYGEATQIPTKENYGPLLPKSLYAASKIASEGLISSFSSMFGFKSLIFRFANITAPTFRTKGRNVIPDFILKLKQNSDVLEILGNGKQEKSYLYVDDCIDGIFSLSYTMTKSCDVFNLGNNDTTKVDKIASIVVEEMKLKNVKLQYTGGSLGWKGDVAQTIISIEKAKMSGWQPTLKSDDAVRESARGILKNYF